MSPHHGMRLERFDVRSELQGIPPTRNPMGIIWTAPRYKWITHATFRAHKNKPDVVTLHDARPIEPEGRVLRFLVPFAHTSRGVVYRPRK
jgi:hypothetical protein